MKKFIFLFCIAAAIALSSCDDGKPHCWEVKLEYKYEGFLYKQIGYEWMTADEFDVFITNAKRFLERLGCTDVKTTNKKVKFSEEYCKAKGEIKW